MKPMSELTPNQYRIRYRNEMAYISSNLMTLVGSIPRFCNNCGNLFRASSFRFKHCSLKCQVEHYKFNDRFAILKPHRKEKARVYQSKRKLRPDIKFKHYIGSFVSMYLSGKRNKPTTAPFWKHVLYSWKDLKSHIESQFNEANGFNWDNYGSVWELDHIIPQCKFDFKDYRSEAFLKCWSLENLQALSCSENAKKAHKC